MRSMIILWTFIIVAFIFIIHRVRMRKANRKANELKEIIFQQRLELINNYIFTKNVLNTFRKYYPHFDIPALTQVINQLKNYFIIVLTATHNNELQKLTKPLLGMPSRVVDDLWHVFILDTRIYTAFCKDCFGFYLHHNSADASVPYQRKQKINSQLYTTWRYACQLENKGDLMTVRSFPMLFKIDDVLNIPQGFSYTLEEFLTHARLQNNTSNKIDTNSGCSGCSSCSGNSENTYTNKNNYRQTETTNSKQINCDDKHSTDSNNASENNCSRRLDRESNFSSDSSDSCSSCGGGD